VEVEGNLFLRWVALYALASVWRRGEMEKHKHVLARLTGWGGAWRGEAMGMDARRVHEYFTKIWPKASQVYSFLLPFIFATSPCLIRFDRDRPSRLRDFATLGGSSL
jgi:hypothetical protein